MKCSLCVLTLFSGAVSFAAVSFNRDIRPIMADTCFRCHGPDKNARMAGMRLDIRDEALKPTKSGVTPIVPGDPEHSAIVQRVLATNPARIMPPNYAHKELTPAQKETIRRWVAEGAKYEGHWAYQAVKRPDVPEIARPLAPLRNPIDNFIQARLAHDGLTPSPEADRRTLIRRVSLDLTGLPPAPREIDAFVNDKSPDAYEKVVDRLLSSPRYAEQQALHWLDAIRYADTCGFHGDNIFPAWPYRDWVLRAFRDNKPFDEFTREQLAGDLLPDATLDQRIASAYNRLNRTSAEGGLQPKEYLAKYAADRARTLSTVWLASTTGCAECHDHKFDPFLSRDFYSLQAFFADIEETGLMPDKGPRAWGTQLELANPEQRAHLEKLRQKLFELLPDLYEKTMALSSRQAEWEKRTLADFEAGKLDWKYQRPISAEATGGTTLTVYNETPVEFTHYDGGSLSSEKKPGNGLVIAGGANPDNSTYTLTFKPGAGDWTALGLEVVQDEGLPGLRLARGADRLVVSEVEALLDGKQLVFKLATSNLIPSSLYPAMAAIDGNSKTGWGTNNYADNSSGMLALRFQDKLHTAADSVITVRIHHDSEYRRATIGRLRLALSDAQYAWPDPEDIRHRQKREHTGLTETVVKGLQTEPDQRKPAQNQAIFDMFQWSSPELEPLMIEAANQEARYDQLDSSIPRVVTTVAVKPREIRVLPRGNFLDESGPVVEPAIPVFMGHLETGGRRATRLDLANWIVSRSNPLTARVFVNRAWREFFGTGLVKTLDDFGSQGEWPVNQELLDWLAAEFMEHWDVRQLLRTIVMSHTYRQSSEATRQTEEHDPDNRLLAHQSRFRVDAEVVRDIALEVSGLLVEKFGGPSVKPYQPDGYLAALNFPKREYSASHGDDLYRRGIYTLWQRTFLHPSLLTFDAPTREECTVNRVNSNTPLQALVLLNDPIYVEASRVFAQHILEKGGRNVTQKIDWAFERAEGRKPSAEERRILTDLHQKSLARFRGAPAEAQGLIHSGEAPVATDVKPVDLAAMTSVARAILNLHETITRN
jgi:Protein of unknown function (DUF1553)/Protein of unknown function (DUF1549)/Planctomycete cytochrome C